MAKFSVIMTPVDDFSGHNKVRYGVGERIELDVKETPPAKPATPVEWSVKSGPATLKPGKLTGSAVVTCGNKGGAVVLELKTKDNTVVASQRFQVVAPEGAKFVKAQEKKKFTHGKDLVCQSALLPSDVSFKWVETREGAAPYEGSGCFKKAEVGLSELADDYAVIHPVRGEWIGNKGGKAGNADESPDNVRTIVPKKYGKGGAFVWNIPWFYRVVGQSGETKFVTAVHKCTVDASGNYELSKLNVKVKMKVPPAKT
jgi:hypothetical protein